MKPRGFWSWFCFLFALVCLLAAAWSANWSWVRFRDFERWAVAENFRMPIDLSKTGKYEARFIHTCTASHGAFIKLEVMPPFAHQIEADAALSNSFQATYSIREQSGHVVQEGTLDAEDFGFDATNLEFIRQDGGAPKPSARFRGQFPKGEYRMIVEVVKPAPVLSTKRQFLVGKYELCGLEKMPALVLGVAAVFLALLGAAGLWISRLIARRRQQQ